MVQPRDVGAGRWSGPIDRLACVLAPAARAILVLILATLILPTPLTAWGREAHQIIANIAQARLSPEAKRGVYSLLRGATLASVSMDADNYRNSHRETSRWHYVDIPIDAAHYVPERDCQQRPGLGDCVLAEVDRLLATLKARDTPVAERAKALRFLVHFVGEIHCPMHTSDANDRGGNAASVTFIGRPTNLHAVWDSALFRHSGYNVTSLTVELERLNAVVDTSGTPTTWAEEAHDVARAVAYRIQADRLLGQTYVDASLPALKTQLWRGGVRLAKLLNGLFQDSAVRGGPATTGAPSTSLPGTQPKPNAPYHGNAKSKVFHATGCVNYNCLNCTVEIVTKEQALKAGYRPHSACVR